MTRANYCEFFRFDNQYCDVFIEDDHFLYAMAEYGNYTGFLVCNEWHIVENSNGDAWFFRHDTVNADTAYLETLEYAPADIAADIIRREYARSIYYSTRGDNCHWYDYETPPTMNECMEAANEYAGIIC